MLYAVWAVLRTLLLCVAALTMFGLGLAGCDVNGILIFLAVLAGVAVLGLAGFLLVRSARRVGKWSLWCAAVLVGLTAVLLLSALGQASANADYCST